MFWDSVLHRSESQIGREEEKEDPRIRKTKYKAGEVERQSEFSRASFESKDKGTVTPVNRKNRTDTGQISALTIWIFHKQEENTDFARFKGEISHFVRKDEELTAKTNKTV